MPTECARVGSAVLVDREGSMKKRTKRRAQLLGCRNVRRARRSNQVQSPHRVLSKVWWLAVNHFNYKNAQRPDVYLRSVRLPRDDLGCHPVWCPNHRRAHPAGPGRTRHQCRGRLSTEAEIG